MQVEVDVKCIETNFGGHDLSGFGDFAPYLLTFKTTKISLQTMDYSPWSSKNLSDRNRLKKFMQVEVDVTCMQTSFGGHGLSSFGHFAPFSLAFKTAKFSLQTIDYSPWSSKNLIDQNQLKKFMQVGVDVTRLFTDFGGHGLSSFVDTTTLKNGQISLLAKLGCHTR